MFENTWSGWASWWASVPPEFAFLLALPFAVAALGLAAEWLRQRPGPASSPGR